MYILLLYEMVLGNIKNTHTFYHIFEATKEATVAICAFVQGGSDKF